MRRRLLTALILVCMTFGLVLAIVRAFMYGFDLRELLILTLGAPIAAGLLMLLLLQLVFALLVSGAPLLVVGAAKMVRSSWQYVRRYMGSYGDSGTMVSYTWPSCLRAGASMVALLLAVVVTTSVVLLGAFQLADIVGSVWKMLAR